MPRFGVLFLIIVFIIIPGGSVPVLSAEIPDQADDDAQGKAAAGEDGVIDPGETAGEDPDKRARDRGEDSQEHTEHGEDNPSAEHQAEHSQKYSGKESSGAVIRRSGEAEKKAEETVSVGGLTVDFTARRVIVDGVEAELSPKEYDLLFYMIRNRGIALTREKLISDVWGYDFFGDDRTLDTHIKLLRKQLGPYADKITTLRGVGYRFEKE
jgi:hypothetical protein